MPSSDGGSRIGGYYVWNQDYSQVGCPVGWTLNSGGWCYLWVNSVNGQTSYTVVLQWPAGLPSGSWMKFGVGANNGAGSAATVWPTAAQTTGSTSSDGTFYQLP